MSDISSVLILHPSDNIVVARRALQPGDVITTSDSHLLAAFKMFGDERFKGEMLIRLFEHMIKPKVKL